MNIFYYQKKFNSITAEKRKRAVCHMSASKKANLLHSFPLIENAASNTCTCSRETAGWKYVVRTALTIYISRRRRTASI